MVRSILSLCRSLSSVLSASIASTRLMATPDAWVCSSPSSVPFDIDENYIRRAGTDGAVTMVRSWRSRLHRGEPCCQRIATKVRPILLGQASSRFAKWAIVNGERSLHHGIKLYRRRDSRSDCARDRFGARPTRALAVGSAAYVLHRLGGSVHHDPGPAGGDWATAVPFPVQEPVSPQCCRAGQLLRHRDVCLVPQTHCRPG